MPVNYLQIRQQIISMGQGVRQREADLNQKKLEALELLRLYSSRGDLLQETIQKCLSANASLRCALPPPEGELTAVFDPAPSAPDHIILAADGSQINPNFHDPVAFGVINVGAFRMSSTGLNEAPSEKVETSLLMDDIDEGGAISEEIVALKRDLAERTFLADLSHQEKHPVVALTDGPLELFRDPKDRPEFQQLFDQYLHALQRLAGYKTATAGYVDRPRSDLLVRALELLKFSDSDLPLAGKNRPLKGVTDSDLFIERLQPGQRTQVFGIQSLSAVKFNGDLALHFFYLNVSLPGNPAMARVEIPAWVACDPTLLMLLHSCLVNQCRVLGSRPFPYVLHRSHEVAVVHFEEKTEISNMIIHELNQQGQIIGGPSNKQAHKDESALKKRYKR